jgi:hypothetical protein
VFMRLYWAQARGIRWHMEAATPASVSEQPYGTNQPEEGLRVLSGLSTNRKVSDFAGGISLRKSASVYKSSPPGRKTGYPEVDFEPPAKSGFEKLQLNLPIAPFCVNYAGLFIQTDIYD